MSSDFTEYQSGDELRKAQKLSVEPTRPPTKIEGYAIQGFIGRGSYGEVWLAIDQKTGKRVAIKFYAQRSSVDVKQLAQEVEKLVVLAADRYVVQLLDVGWDASPPYYVMDFIDSGSLEDLIKSGESVPVARAIEVFRDIATGLMHLHGKGVLHCDLKPGNVLLDQDGNPRLADFGQSRLKTDNSSALGTLFYMAPEQADLSAMPDAKWDVYGLGAVLFTLLTGKPPYFCETLKSDIESSETLHDRLKLYRQTLFKAPKPKQHRSVPGVDRALADVIDRCIAARPSERFPSAQSVLVALQDRETKKQNRPLLLSGILGPLLLLLMMSGFGWWAVRQATSDADKAIITKSVDSNNFAARLAARSASEQLNEYFRVLQQVAKDETFLDSFAELIDDEKLLELRQKLSDPNNNGTDANEKLRNEFVAHPARGRLHAILQRLMADPDGEYPEAASWFVADRMGNQVAGVFEGSKNSGTVGKNYSFRNYFTGFPEDLVSDAGAKKYPVAEELDQRAVIEKPHLSASFISQASGIMKVAFSTPIRNSTGDVEGIVAITVNLGKLVDFDDSLEHYVMLVDNRKNSAGEGRGVILEHPLFLRAKELDDKNRIPSELTDVTADVVSLVNHETGFDPLGETQQGKQLQYDRKFIVAVADVAHDDRVLDAVSGQPPATETDGVVVVAFEDYESVLAPSKSLSERLGRLALVALTFLLLVAFGMWLLATRMLRENRRSHVGMSSGGTLETFSSSSIPSTATNVSFDTIDTSKGPPQN